jgi:hypothetical protein
MPLKRMLDKGSFDPTAVTILLEAYHGVVAELGLEAPEEKVKAAKLLIDLAREQTDLDPTKLRDRVTDAMLNDSVVKMAPLEPSAKQARAALHRQSGDVVPHAGPIRPANDHSQI